MRPYHQASSKSWALSSDRDFKNENENSDKLCNYINSLSTWEVITRAKVIEIMHITNKNANRLLTILCNHGFLKKKCSPHAVQSRFFRKRNIKLTSHDVSEASTYLC